MAALTDILKPLDPAGSQPLYQQLQRAIREAIERRLLGPDDALPAERVRSEPVREPAFQVVDVPAPDVVPRRDGPAVREHARPLAAHRRSVRP